MQKKSNEKRRDVILHPKIDPLTGETFIPRRKYQKFASVKNKMKYNNIMYKERAKELARAALNLEERERFPYDKATFSVAVLMIIILLTIMFYGHFNN